MLSIQTNAHFLPEKQYVFDVLLTERLGIGYQLVITNEPDYVFILPSGKTLVIEDHFWNNIPSGQPYLQSQYIPEIVEWLEKNRSQKAFPPFDEPIPFLFGEPFLLNSTDGLRCTGDLIASIFFMLTRWEEYVLDERDQHNRFAAQTSLAFKHCFLDLPVVDIWVKLFGDMLKMLGADYEQPSPTIKLQFSCDVDHPLMWWSPFNRLKTMAGNILKRQDWDEIKYNWKNHFWKKNDPFDTFDAIMDLCESKNIKAHFNFMGHRAKQSDAYYPINHPFARSLMAKIQKRGHVIGFHPSYEAFDNYELFASELQSLREICDAPILTGRQHYLRFAIPQTWQTWDDAGMKWDSSMGYPEQEGFRCGTAHDFPVFNILTRQKLNLREKPLIAMDVTLAQYRALDPEEALLSLNRLMDSMRNHGGDFTLLWHNSSINTHFWQQYQAVLYRFFENF